jgi:hypothetical protein
VTEERTIEATTDAPGTHVSVAAVVGRMVTLQLDHGRGTPRFVYLTAREAREVADALQKEAAATERGCGGGEEDS